MKEMNKATDAPTRVRWPLEREPRRVPFFRGRAEEHNSRLHDHDLCAATQPDETKEPYAARFYARLGHALCRSRARQRVGRDRIAGARDRRPNAERNRAFARSYLKRAFPHAQWALSPRLHRSAGWRPLLVDAEAVRARSSTQADQVADRG